MTAPQRDKDDVRNSTATCISFSTTKQADSLEYLSQTLFQALWQIASGARPRLVVTEKKNDTQSGDTGANHQPMIINNCLPSLVAWHQVLRETVACRGRNAGLLSTTPPHNNQDEKKHHNVRHGKPWDIEVRLAASLYKRLTSRLSATQRRNKNTTQDNTVVTLLLTSDHGVVRPVSSAVALAQLIWTTAEPPAWRGTVSPQDAVVRVVTPARQAVLQAAGLAPCPHCAAWKQSLWWHVQTQHGTTHATAKEAAPCTERALVVYKPESSLVTQVQHAQPSQPSTKETFGTPNNDDTDKHRIPAKSATEHSRRAQAFTYAQNGQLKELQHAVAQGWVDAVHDVDDKGATLLHWAAGSGYVEVVQYLIQECRCPPRQGQQGKRRGFAGRTALHWACRKGHLAVVQYLVEVTQGAAVHDTTADGTAAVAWAAWQGHDDILHYLYDHTTVNLRALNSFGCNALLWAAQGTASSATVQWLVDTAQCPLLHVNDNRHGVLHKAAQRNRPEIVAWFQSYVMATFSTVDDVGRNADQILGLIAPDREGCTPSDLAGMEGHDKVAAQVQECERLLWHLVSPCAFPLSWKNAFDPTAVPGDYGPGCGVARLCELHQQIMTCSSSNEPKMDAPREKETAAPSTPVALATRAPKSLLFNFPVLLTIMVLLAASVTTEASILYDGHRQTLEDATAELPEDNPFKVVPEAFVIGPTVFPKPSDVQHLDPRNDSNNQQPLVPYLQPILGRHRPSKDAVLLFASEYRLENYVLFVESLRATGFTGDICMVIHPIHDWQGKPRLQEYLQSYALSSSDGEKDDTDDGEPHVVVYAPKPDCFNMERQHVDSSKGGTRTCLFHNLYGKQDTETGSIVPVLDPRSDRTVSSLVAFSPLSVVCRVRCFGLTHLPIGLLRLPGC